MEAAAVDKLIEKGPFRSDTALAIAGAIDIAITAANLVTVPALDARFAKVDARFSDIEKTIVDTKVWAVGLYASLVIALFSALALDHHWLARRQDELNARSDQRLEALEVRTDQRFREHEARLNEIRAQQDAKLDEIRALITRSVVKQRTKRP
jgi:hypothetical protein